jgi:hypothetical protein
MQPRGQKEALHTFREECAWLQGLANGCANPEVTGAQVQNRVQNLCQSFNQLKATGDPAKLSSFGGELLANTQEIAECVSDLHHISSRIDGDLILDRASQRKLFGTAVTKLHRLVERQ